MARTDTASRVIAAPPDRVYQALVDPQALTAWLPPDGMSGRFERFDARPGGSYRLVLTYADASTARGKATADSDVVEARFVDVVPGVRVAQAVEFVSDDPAYAGTMTMTWEVTAVDAGTRVDIRADGVPAGISAEDHAAGLASSLANLATHLERALAGGKRGGARRTASNARPDPPLKSLAAPPITGSGWSSLPTSRVPPVKATLRFTAAPAAALICVLLAPAAVLAAGTTKDPYGEQTPLNLPADAGGAAHADVSSGGGSLARTFIGLAVVVAVIYGLTWVMRQMKASKEERSHGFGLSTEASMPLGPGRSVHLIRAGRELVLVGSAEQGVVPIRTYTEDEARALGLLAPPELESGASRDEPGASTTGDRIRNAIGDVLERVRERTVR